MKIKNIINLIAIVLLIGSCQKSTTEKQNDAVFKSIKKVYELKPDGSMIYQYEHKLKYITHFSFNRLYGESFIIYNPQQQTLKFNQVETTMADGKVVEAPANAFNKVLPRFAAGAPAFNHLREMVVTHTGLELGCTVDFDYELHSKAGYLPFLNENIVLQEDVPVENLEIVVKVPEGTALNYKLLNIDAKVKSTQKDGYTQYTWTFKNLEHHVNEPNQPHGQRHLARLIFSNVNMAEALQQISNNDLTLSDEMKQFVTKRITGKKKEIHIIRELQKMIGDEMNHFDIPIEYTAYSARPLKDVWKSNGATDIERNMLLNKMLQHSGINSQMVYAIPADYYNDVPGVINGTGHFCNWVKTNNEEFIITADSKQANNLLFRLKDDVLLNVRAELLDKPAWITEVEPKVAVKGNFELNIEGDLNGQMDVAVNGVKNPYFNYLDDSENAQEVIQSVFSEKSIQKIDVKKFDHTGSQVHADIEQKEVWKNQGDYYFLTLPESEYGLKGEHLNVLLKERKTPLQLSQPLNESYEYSVILPEGLNFTAPELDEVIENDLGSVSINFSADNKNLKINKSLKINHSLITPEAYTQFKDLLDAWNKETYREIILKKSNTE